MDSKRDVEDLIQKLLELIRKLVGSTCFTKEELDDIINKLRQAVDELQKVVG
jgi:predicted house-cleaning noncanonical NTP pyrophosphatase (MazG superfamily)